MDRRHHQLILTVTACGALGTAMLSNGPALRAQEPTPAPSPTVQTPPEATPSPSPATAPAVPEPPRRPRPFLDRPLPPPDAPPGERPPRPLRDRMLPPPPDQRPEDPKTDRKLEKQMDRKEMKAERQDILDRMKERRDTELNAGPRERGTGPRPDGPPDRKGPRPGGPPDGPLREMLDRLPPGEARDAFQRNLDRWRDLPPAERQELRAQAGQRIERIQEEVDNVLRDNNLQLSEDQRQVFRLRYVQERRKLERSLREHMEAERTRRMPEIVEQLKREFNHPPAASTLRGGPQPPPRPPGGGPAGSPPPPPPPSAAE